MTEPLLRTRWVEIYPTFGFCLKYYTCFSDNDTGTLVINLGFPQIFIDTPFEHKPKERYDFEGGQYGLYWHDHNFVVCWGKFIKFFEMPYVEIHLNSFVFNKDKTWFNTDKWDDYEKNEPNVYTESYPYTYILEDGTVQERTAICVLRKHIKQIKLFKWLNSKWFIRERLWVDVRFDDEVGERAGSWKGGVTGCCFDLKKGQTIRQGLREMEQTRKFD